MLSSRILLVRTVVLLILLIAHIANADPIENKMRNDPDLSEFLVLLHRSEMANVTLKHKQVTVFAPINAAFQKYGQITGDVTDLVLYHISNIPITTDKLRASLYSDLGGNPPLWITHKTGRYHNDIFINNAQILVSQSNIHGSRDNGIEQILHKIDEVLVPTRSSTSANVKLFNPNAYEFLEYYESFIMHPFRLRSYRQRVQQMNKQKIFQNESGGHTFFIPIDEGFKNKPASLVDDKVIDGHVIPNHVLFTNPTTKGEPFATLANGDNTVRVMISFSQEIGEHGVISNYVKSHTIMGDGKHSPGVVISEIVKANIPVKNGVIHLIKKPLMVVDNNVKELLQEKGSGILSSFVKAINDADYKEFYNIIERSHDITLFAPSNAAWTDDFTLNSVVRNKEKFRNILKMHLIVDKRLYVDKIRENRGKKEPTADPRKDLYFDVTSSGPNKTVTVEGGGVNATVILADLAASNGIIHIIDRVLGVPFTTVLDKLRTDPSLNYTFLMGRRGGFNYQLNDTTKKFTFFVPRDKAWEDARIEYPSAIKKLFLPDFSYHATNILEHHLVIADEPFTMDKIIQLASPTRTTQNFMNNHPEVLLPTVRGELYLAVQEMPDHNTDLYENESFIIHWKGQKIPVYKPNVACTNGIIHVIDVPFLQEGDIQVNGAINLGKFAPYLLSVLLLLNWCLI